MTENMKENEIEEGAEKKIQKKNGPDKIRCGVCKDIKAVFAGYCYIPCPDCS